jgi:hypothetical protein
MARFSINNHNINRHIIIRRSMLESLDMELGRDITSRKIPVRPLHDPRLATWTSCLTLLWQQRSTQ